MEKRYLTLEEIHAALLDMLRQVDKVCKAENIPYFLSGGTLLGAVRHKGFIPWDDDVDLMMPRPVLQRFQEAAPKYLGARYELCVPGCTPGYVMPWPRLIDHATEAEQSIYKSDCATTLFLDIFPIDGLPRNRWLSEAFFKYVRMYDILYQCARKTVFGPGERLQWLKRPLMALVNFRPAVYHALRLYRAAGRIPFEGAQAAGVCVVTHYGSRERMPASVFSGATEVTFCGEPYPAPVGWDTYLRNLYGDYMQLPPEEKRASLHNLKVTYREPMGE